MWMEVDIYSVKAKSQAGNISQSYNNNTKMPNLQDSQLGILKIYAFCQKIQQVLGPGKNTAGVTYLFMRIHLKSCHIFPLKVAAILLNEWLK